MFDSESNSEQLPATHERPQQEIGRKVANFLESTPHIAKVSPITLARLSESYGDFIDPHTLAVYRQHKTENAPIAPGLRTSYDLFGDDLSSTPKIILFGDTDVMHRVSGIARYDTDINKAIVRTRSASTYLVCDVSYIGLMTRADYAYYQTERDDEPRQTTLFFNSQLSLILNRTEVTEQKIGRYIQRFFYRAYQNSITPDDATPTEKHETQLNK